MENEKPKKRYIAPRPKETSCDTCMYFDYDEASDSDVCTLDLDEDEMVDFLGRNTGSCPYYRFYDEYKSVHKQI
jgi:hypothetical protein